MIDSSQIDNINRVTGKESKTQAEKDRASLGSNLDQFLKLLTTQLRNQDPTSPTDTNQLTQQIASLSQVEQQININSNLNKLLDMYNATQYNSLVDYIGKEIEAKGSATELKDGKANLVYYLGEEAQTATVTVKDSAGATVYTGPLSDKTAGRHVFEWDGKTSAGGTAAPGIYTVSIEAKNPAGDKINSPTFIYGIITSIDSANGKIFASIGELSVEISNLTSVRLPRSNTNS